LLAKSAGRPSSTARYDAAVIRRDEKYVLRKIVERIQAAEAELNARGRAPSKNGRRSKRRKRRGHVVGGESFGEL